MGKHHVTLGVDPSASPAEIKKAFYALSKKDHPDMNPGDKEVEEKYKEISAAYSALEDGDDGDDREQKAREYAEKHFRDSGFDDIMQGIMRDSFIHQQFHNVGQTGSNAKFEIGVPVMTLYKGGTINVEGMIPSWTPKGFGYVHRSQRITVEPNTPVGTQYVFPNEGCVGADGTIGSLIVNVSAAPQGIYECDGLNLIVRGKIPSTDALIGKRKKFLLPSGEEQEFDVPLGCQNNQAMTIRGKGLTGANGRVGNLIIVFELRSPNLTEEQRKIIAEALEKIETETSTSSG
jgi:DnaJ-class molecular chaperone